MKDRIKALIFDLDNCLAPATEVGEALFEPVFEAIQEMNHGMLSPAQLQRAFDDMWIHPYDWVADEHEFSVGMFDAGWQELRQAQVSHVMQGYGDLAVLEEFSCKRFLVTSGFQKLQQSKIEALSLEKHFDEIFIDAIDQPERIGKKGLFLRIMHKHDLDQNEVIIVGDNKDSELAAGRELGLTVVQTLRQGVVATDLADHHVASLQELKDWLEGLPETR